jgi:hypothetical protein
MSTSAEVAGFPPKEVTILLRIEGLAVFAAALIAYQVLGGNWWIFALLILAPDLAMLGGLVSPAFGARAYNAAHTYTVPAVAGALAWLAGATYLLPFAIIWIAHIGADRALGYGLKYPGTFHQTHLGLIGKARKAQKLADAS